MKKYFLALALLATFSFAANAQFGKINVGKVTDAATKGVKAMTLSDAEISQYAQEYIDWIEDLEYRIFSMPIPDITIFLDMPYEKSIELMKNRNNE